MTEPELPQVIVAYEYKTGAGNRRKWKYPNERFGPKHWERFPDGHRHDMVMMGTYVLQEKEIHVTEKCLDQGSENVVTFLWGVEGEYQEAKSYMFKTQIEAEAFRLALSECKDWAALKWTFAVKEISYD